MCTYHVFLAWVNAAWKPPGFLVCCGNRCCQAPLQTAPKGQQQRARCSMLGSFAVFDFNSAIVHSAATNGQHERHSNRIPRVQACTRRKRFQTFDPPRRVSHWVPLPYLPLARYVECRTKVCERPRRGRPCPCICHWLGGEERWPFDTICTVRSQRSCRAGSKK